MFIKDGFVMAYVKLRLIGVGRFYIVDGEPIPRALANATPEANPLDVLWELHKEARREQGSKLVDDTYPDEPIRRIVGRTSSTRKQ